MSVLNFPVEIPAPSSKYGATQGMGALIRDFPPKTTKAKNQSFTLKNQFFAFYIKIFLSISLLQPIDKITQNVHIIDKRLIRRIIGRYVFVIIRIGKQLGSHIEKVFARLQTAVII